MAKKRGKPGGDAHGKKHKFKKPKKSQQQLQDAPLPRGARRDADLEDGSGGSGAEEESELEVSDEDVAFVTQHARRIGFLENLDAKALDKSVKEKQKAGITAAAAAAAAKAAAAAAGKEGGEEGADGGEDEGETGEADYEKRPRAREEDRAAPSKGLPVKTPDGRLVYAEAEGSARAKKLRAAAQQVAASVGGILVEDTLEDEERQRREAARAAKAEAEAERAAKARERAAAAAAAAAVERAAASGAPPALAALAAARGREERRSVARQQMAATAQQLLAAPEKFASVGLRVLTEMAKDADPQISRLAMLSALTVFKDILPDYKIRPPSEAELAVKASKDVQALRDHEAALLRGYQTYLKLLLAAADAAPPSGGGKSGSGGKGRGGGKKGGGGGGGKDAEAAAGGAGAKAVERALATARVAVRCLAGLAAARPAFNYASDVLQALVPRMAASDADIGAAASGAVRELLTPDAASRPGLEALQLVADLVKRHKCAAPPRVVEALLVLRLREVPLASVEDGKGAKPPPKKRKKKGQLEKDFQEAEAGPDPEEQAYLQSKMLEALFETFFRVLKHCSATITANQQQQQAAAAAAATPGAPAPSSSTAALDQPWPAARVAARFPLLAPVLAGLGRYSHLISVDYFNDLMSVLQELLGSGVLPLRQRLEIMLTASAILRGQGEALNIDRRAFYTQLYAATLLAPLQPLLDSNPQQQAGGKQNQQPQQQGGKQQQNAKRRRQEEEEEEEGGAEGGGVGADAEEEEDVAAMIAADALTGGTFAQGSAAAAAAAAAIVEQLRPSAPGGEIASAFGGVAAAGRRAGAPEPTAVLLVRALEQLLLGVKQTDVARLAAFVKRLASLMLQTPPGETIGMAALLLRMIRRYPRLGALLEWEGGAPIGGRSYDPCAADPSDAGALATALWELPLAARHYHPHVSASARAMLALTPGAAANGGGDGGEGAPAAASAGAGGLLTGAAGPQELALTYDGITRFGRFRPAPPAPRGGGGGQPGKARVAAAARALAAAGARPLCDDLRTAIAAQDASAAKAAAAAADAGSGGGRGTAKRERQEQQQREASAVAAAQALEEGSEEPEGSGEGDAVAAALQRHWQESRRFDRNVRLRREAAVLEAKVSMFRERLMQQAAAEKKAAAAGSSGGKGAAAAGGKKVVVAAASGKRSSKQQR